ncbi:protein of unknown function [Candidatus Methylacidiphilum fumarolicum]|uniref:FERM domain-containing protein n=1 Tax=Candidatus Methylacidiphilum fumarolicum TaxID=591154 RepID=A0ABM9IFU6_9BACT|nr:protein of unknown function [Candidatus Methylacidiphilum fumarolicum]
MPLLVFFKKTFFLNITKGRIKSILFSSFLTNTHPVLSLDEKGLHYLFIQ